jgi:hypothetical protein
VPQDNGSGARLRCVVNSGIIRWEDAIQIAGLCVHGFRSVASVQRSDPPTPDRARALASVACAHRRYRAATRRVSTASHPADAPPGWYAASRRIPSVILRYGGWGGVPMASGRYVAAPLLLMQTSWWREKKAAPPTLRGRVGIFLPSVMPPRSLASLARPRHISDIDGALILLDAWRNSTARRLDGVSAL